MTGRENKGIYTAIVGIVIVTTIIYGVTSCGNSKGEIQAYEAYKIELADQYEAKIGSLEKQIVSADRDYAKQIASLKASQEREITNLLSAHNSDVQNLSALHENEIIEVRDSSYRKGQTDARDAMQQLIDSKARVGNNKNDWNAPMFGTR
jgi:protein-tyrosine-phosphatase